MSRYRILWRVIFLLAFMSSSNCFPLIVGMPWLWYIAFMVFLVVNIFPGFTDSTIPGKRLKLCNHGAECLLIFSASIVPSLVLYICAAVFSSLGFAQLLTGAIISVIAHVILFWNGIISVYCTSVQLGIRTRVIGLICGPIPVAHLFALGKIIRVTLEEVRFESEKAHLNSSRKAQRICKTRYPILLVHGVFFRDFETVNYWGRIPEQLEQNGARIFYGEHHSAQSIEHSAQELTERIKAIVAQTGCKKVNIIAHSKGGLDCRYAIEHFGAGKYIASLTTINTPHRGCVFAEYLLGVVSTSVKEKVAAAYNAAAGKLGDSSPDFLAAVGDLTHSKCIEYFAHMPQPQGIYCQSVGSVIKKATHGKFPLNFSFPIVKHFDGENDGLVAETAFAWGDRYTLLKNDGKRGISHGDMIDLNRENIPGFDVREFYVQLVAELNARGL